VTAGHVSDSLFADARGVEAGIPHSEIGRMGPTMLGEGAELSVAKSEGLPDVRCANCTRFDDDRHLRQVRLSEALTGG
jgi:hypothetical protein